MIMKEKKETAEKSPQELKDDALGAIRGGAIETISDSFTEVVAARNQTGDNSVALQIGANANQKMNLSLDE